MKKFIFAATLGLTATPVLAQDYSLGAGLTSLGATVEGTYELNNTFAVRGQFIRAPSLSGSETVDVNGADYDIDGDGTFGGVAVVGDFYPTPLGWRLSGGLFFSNTSLDASFSGPESFDGELAFEKDVAPMLTTGYKLDLGNRFYLAGDIGAIFSELEAETNSTDPAVQNDVDDINDELADIPAFPYVSLTVGYRW